MLLLASTSRAFVVLFLAPEVTVIFRRQERGYACMARGAARVCSIQQVAATGRMQLSGRPLICQDDLGFDLPPPSLPANQLKNSL